MAEQTLLDKIREWIGGAAFDIFLWSIRMTSDEYLALLESERSLTTDAPEVTVGNSDTVSEYYPWKSCPVCLGYREWSGFEHMPNCPACHETGKVFTTKPE